VGEKMRLSALLPEPVESIAGYFILEEPTSNLEIQNIEILTAAIYEYQGTLIVVFHGECFQEKIKVQREIIVCKK
jgi:ATPase subunit of ABC transporter with duplicated ATPase domains